MRTGLLVLLLLLMAAAPQDPPLSKEVADLVRRYSAVAEWRGHFWATETGAVSWTSVNGDYWGTTRVDRSSHGQFRMARNDRHWEPERGMLQWGGNNKERTGEVSAVDLSHVSQWNKWGSGSEQTDKTSGAAPLFTSQFEFWLPSKFVTVRTGDLHDKPLLFERVGRSLSEESRGNGTSRLKETSLNKTEPADWYLPPLSPSCMSAEALYRVVSGGPGVLKFACELKSRADTRKSTPEITDRSSVTLFPIYDDLEVQVTIAGYEGWMPKGSIPQPTSPGHHLEATAVLVQKAKGPPPKAKRFRFELVEVSREPGVCMNWPRFGPDGDTPPAEDPKPDLRFGPANGAILTKEDLAAELPPIKDKAGRESAAARVDSYDFGGTADLRVVCDLEDGREICGILRTGGSELLSIPLPYRRSGSRIAHPWQERRKSTGGDQDDADLEPVGDGNSGDGYSTFEEYRGFVMNREHLRTKPDKKDLFVRNDIGQKALPGLFQFADLSHLDVHYELRADEMPKSRRMNVNRSAGSPRRSEESQHGVILNTVSGGAYSRAVIQERKLGRPKTTDHVEILLSLFAPGNEAELSSTIAHELLHSIGGLHHGDTDLRYVEWSRKNRMNNGIEEAAWYEEQRLEPGKGGWRKVGASCIIRLLDDGGNEYRAMDDPVYLVDPKKGYVGCSAGEHSGDVDCVMRYRCANAFRPKLGPETDRRRVPGAEPVGWKLCTSAAGTDFNGPNGGFIRYGDGTRGNCDKRFCVRDDAPESKAP